MTKQFTGNINQLSQQINSIVMAGAGAQRVFSLIDEKAETDDGFVTLVDADIAPDGTITESDHHTGHWAWKNPNDNGKVSYRELRGDVRLIDVDFGYEPNKEVLHDVSVYAEPGQKVAFVGATGAGKTTITNLINRFYDIADGKIRYDGININKICKADLRRSLGIVLQDTHLFTGTVRENIAYGKLDATEQEVIAAAKLANADGFIRRLPNGYDTMLTGDGANLSQGQRQLLAIARAAIADPPVLILDEATSSIDTRTERIVQDGMDKLMKQNHLRYCPSSFHGPQCRLHHGPGTGPDHRARYPRPAHRRERQILSALYRKSGKCIIIFQETARFLAGCFSYIEEEITRVKKLTNMTTHSFDLEHFGNNAGLKEFLRRHSLDGLELMEIGEDEKQILQKKMWSVFIGSIIPAGIVSGSHKRAESRMAGL